MRRFYLSPEVTTLPLLTLTGREAHHATRVLRLKVGDSVTVHDGQGHILACQITKLQRHDLELSVQERTFVAAPACRITLFQSLTKGKSFEWILQKATEIGVARVVPVLTERAVPEIDAANATHKRDKWQWVAIDALKQSGAAWLPEIAEASRLEALSRNAGSELNVVAALDAASRHPRVWFQEFQVQHQRAPASVAVWVGPEGDFTAEEMVSLRQAGILPITLGTHVLRAETAAIYALTVIHSELAWEAGRR